jgi:D-3-phosphoglycerate dehydrogenase
MRLVSLTSYSEVEVRELLSPGHRLDIELAPPPPISLGQLTKLVCDADLVIADARQKHALTRGVLSAMDRCRLIQVPAVGFESVDHLAASDFGIPVANAAGFNRDAVADWTVMAIILQLRNAASFDRQMRGGGWPQPSQSHEIRGRTIGIIGLGNIGSSVARRLLQFGAKLIFSDAIPRSFPRARQVPFEELIRVADVVSLHAPLDASTRTLINAETLASMRPGAILVNAARGAMVDEAALVDALRSGHLGGAALDVFAEEPLAINSPLRQMENVLLSPHVAGTTDQSLRRVHSMTGVNLRRAIAGRPPKHVVNGVPWRRS